MLRWELVPSAVQIYKFPGTPGGITLLGSVGVPVTVACDQYPDKKL